MSELLKGTHILLVDDEPIVRWTFSTLMKLIKLEADVAEDAKQALEFSKNKQYGLIVSDIMLPGIDGLTLIEQLRPQQPLAAFVVVTGVDEAHQQRHREVYRYISTVVRKPWDNTELLRVLERALSEKHDRHTRKEGQTSILLVAGDPLDAKKVRACLDQCPGAYALTVTDTTSAATTRLDERVFDVIILSVSRLDSHGAQAIRALRRWGLETPILVLSDKGQPPAFDAVGQGAQDHLFKDRLTAEMLQRAIKYAQKQKQTEAMLSQLAHFDQLTGLTNRATWQVGVAKIIDQAKLDGTGFALLLVNLDGFKRVNETLGYDRGDVVLQSLGKRYRRVLRDYDTVARLGGDEFGLVLPQITDTRELTQLANKLTAVTSKPITLDSSEITVTASIGIAIFPEAGRVFDELLRSADTAMYACKWAGGDGFRIFRTGDQKTHVKSPILESALRRAVSEHCFELQYQPIYHLKSGKLSGFEAFLRWPDSPYDNISPKEFIPVLEDTGLITELGQWVIDTAIKQLKNLRSRRGCHNLVMSINLSAKQFDQAGLVETLRKALDQHNVPASSVELEITEDVALSENSIATELLNALESLGVRLTIDDFGTGFSSLAALVRYSVHTLKIDQSLIGALDKGSKHRTIVKAIIGLGRQLKIDVVAEGVETIEQLTFLRDEECDYVQGFLIGRPSRSCIENLDSPTLDIPTETVERS